MILVDAPQAEAEIVAQGFYLVIEERLEGAGEAARLVVELQDLGVSPAGGPWPRFEGAHCQPRVVQGWLSGSNPM